MAHILLNNVLDGQIDVHILLKWILNDHLKNENAVDFLQFHCSQEDFASYFLNFVHERAVSSSNENEELPLKTSTPKRIEKKWCSTPSRRGDLNNKKWQPLFTEKQNENDDNSQGTPGFSSDYIMEFPEIKHTLNKSHGSPHHTINSINNSFHTNPISPLYNNQHSLTTPKSKRQSHSPRSIEKVPTLCLGDFLVQPRLSGKKRLQKSFSENSFESISDEATKTKNSRSRRINPTSLNKKPFNGSIEETENTFKFKNESFEVKVENVNQQRNALLEERAKIVTNPSDSWQMSNIKIPFCTPANTEDKQEIIFNPNEVTFKKQLDLIAIIYSELLQHNFVLNITSELYFLISLLITKEYKSPMSEDKVADNLVTNEPLNVFSNIHNRVYFSIKVLERSFNLLFILDRLSLKFLLDNKSLTNSSVWLHKVITVMYDSITDKNVEIVSGSIDLNVCFISDTDNRENFPSDSSFHAFRKQRDTFYEILRLWESNHLQSGWNFTGSLGGKIKFLLNMHSDPANFMHFSRLFKAQLLKNCTGSWDENDTYSNQFSFLSSLPGMNSEKILLLKNRIATKQFNGGINTAPSFTGYQEFYKDFLIAANNYAFYSHFKDALILDIVEMNNIKFDDYELEDHRETWSDCSLKKSFVLCLKTLRILAKFLGFIESLPYKSETAIPENVLKTHISLRNQVPLSLNLKSILQKSVENKTLVLTIPWVTKYLSMLDYVKLRIPQFLEIFEILFEIHHRHALETIPIYLEKNDAAKTEILQAKKHFYKTTLINLCLGWLFELPHFPEGLYYEWYFKKGIKLNSDMLNTSVFANEESKCSTEEKCKVHIDNLGMVDHNILRICCPYLEEIRNLLSSRANFSNSSSKIKHITPVTASPSELTKKKVQLQLEEAFFNGQPASVRKTVEFVSERIASACVKQICYKIVPEFKKNAMKELKGILVSAINCEKENLQVWMKTKTSEFCSLKFKELEDAIQEAVGKYISNRVSPCIDSLLSFDALLQTKEVCSIISSRLCKERIKEWQKSHVRIDIFTKDSDSIIRNILSDRKNGKSKSGDSLAASATDKKCNKCLISPTELLETVRSFVWDVMERPSTISHTQVNYIFQKVIDVFHGRCDLNGCMRHCICQLTVDLVLSLIAHTPQIMNKRLLNEVIQYFKDMECSSANLFDYLICPRNVMMLAQSPDSQKSWEALAIFMSLLLKEQLLTCETFETQALAIYKCSWDEASSKTISTFYRTVVDNYKSLGGDMDKFIYLMRFLSDYCAELDDLHLDISEDF